MARSKPLPRPLSTPRALQRALCHSPALKQRRIPNKRAYNRKRIRRDG